MKYKNLLAAVFAAGLMFTNNAVDAADKECLYQPGLLQSLTLGYYDGFITVKDLKKLGNIGIGTFQGVNGEMILLDGHMYQALGDGTVVEASPKELVPFADVTSFEVDGTKELSNIATLGELKAVLDGLVMQEGKNNFFVIKAKGSFNSILVRSELKQYPPYRTLAVALAEDQREFTYDNIDGTMVALYCPEYMKGINTPGWHFHFISEDKQKGGHVLAANLKKAKLEYDVTRGFKMLLPKDKAFAELDLAKDQSEDIRKVEQE